MKILILDDDESILEICNKYLSDHVTNLFKTQTISSAINHIKMNDIDICIIDLNLAGDSGLEFVQELKKLNKQSRCIICSAAIDNETIKKANALGVVDFIKKPFDFHDLVASITQKE